MKILITGGTGFVGRNLIKLLLQNNYKLNILTRQNLTSGNNKVTYFKGKIEDYHSVDLAASGCDIIIHMAAQLGEWGDPKMFYSTNIEGTRNIAKVTQKHNIKKLIHISTDSVLNEGKPLRNVTEKWKASNKAIGFYGKTKSIAEKIILEETNNLTNTFVLRPRFVWGGDDNVLCKTFIDAINNNRFLWLNNGDFLSSTCHVYNCCHAIKLILLTEKKGGIYHVTDGSPKIFKDFMTKWLSAYGVYPPNKSMPTKFAFTIAKIVEAFYKTFRIKSLPPISTFGVASVGNEVTLNDQKIRTELGYKEIITFEEALKEISNFSTVF